jgi:hypothetical protein
MKYLIYYQKRRNNSSSSSQRRPVALSSKSSTAARRCGRQPSPDLTSKSSSDSDSESGDEEVAQRQKKKGQRLKKRKVSLSFDALPPAIKPEYFSTVLPTLRAILSARSNIWRLDGKDGSMNLLAWARQVLLLVYPEDDFDVGGRSQIYLRVSA